MKETESPVSEQVRNRRFCFARCNKLGIERAYYRNFSNRFAAPVKCLSRSATR